MMVILPILILLSWTWPAQAGWKAPREALDKRYTVGDYRIHYTLEGENAFPANQPAEGRATRATELVGGMAEQISAAVRIYSQEMGLVPPLQQPRYQGVQAIDIHLLDMGDKRMGSTGDEPQHFRYRYFEAAPRVLSMAIATRWKAPNATPGHEVFHAYQYGYTYFKTPWFLEGMARSMESAITGKPQRSEPLPQDAKQLHEMLGRSYDAAPIWNRLFLLCDPQCAAKPEGRFCGGGLARTVLERFREIDRKAAQARGISPDDWPEEEQRSPANNPWMLRGVLQAIEARCPSEPSGELANFRRVVREAATP